MVRDNADGNVPLMLFVIFLARNLADPVTQGPDGIHVENGIHVLYHHGQTLQSHSRIDVLLL